MKKVQFLNVISLALNIAVLVCYALTAVLMYNEAAKNDDCIVQVSFYLGLLGSITVFALAAFVISIIAYYKHDGERTSNLMCGIFNGIVFAFSGATFCVILMNSQDDIPLKVSLYSNMIIAGIWASLSSTALASVGSNIAKKHVKPKKNFNHEG